MKDCYNKKLASIILDDGLCKIGEIKMSSPYSSSALVANECRLGLRKCTVRTNKGGYFATTFAGLDDPASRLTEYTVSAIEQDLYFSNGNYDIFIGGKYELLTIEMSATCKISFNIDDLKFAADINKLIAGNGKITGSIENLADKTDLGQIQLFNNSGIVGDISSFTGNSRPSLIRLENTSVSGNLDELTGLNVSMSRFNLTNTNVTGTTSGIATFYAGFNNISIELEDCKGITGDIVNLGSLSKIKNFYMAYCKVNGTLESLIEALRPNKTAGATVIFDFSYTNVTYQGNKLTSAVSITF